jgi:rubredoxin
MWLLQAGSKAVNGREIKGNGSRKGIVMVEEQSVCVKINLPGGVVSAGDLYEILLIAENAGAERIELGNRQQLYFHIPAVHLQDLQTDMLKAEIKYEANENQYPNVISSYVSDSIFGTEGWLKEGTYKDILDQLDYNPRLKINVTDGNQTFVPLFSGNINFISAPLRNYFYCYIRFPKTNNLYCWPSLVYAEDLFVLSRIVEQVIMSNAALFYDQPTIDHQLFFKLVAARNANQNQEIAEPLSLPDFHLPYYEGFSSYGNGRNWLGIYQRTGTFALDFLKAVCTLCIKTRIGQLYTTPWKSFLIKEIQTANCFDWEILLCNHRINTGHSGSELNWQLADLCKESLELKMHLVREIDACDLKTSRLCFAIQMTPKSGLTGSVLIRKQAHNTFDVLNTQDFNPNSRALLVHRRGVDVHELAGCLIELTGQFYDYLTKGSAVFVSEGMELEEDITTEIVHQVYQCKYCLSQYDQRYGDQNYGIEIDTDFESLETYQCSVCDSPRESFVKVELKAIPGTS